MGMDNELVVQFNKELSSIYESRPPLSKQKIQGISRSALKAKVHYKCVVFSVEKFLAKCKIEFKIPVLYIIDSIIRASKHQHKEKDVYGDRFLKNFSKTVTDLLDCAPAERPRVVRTINLWGANGVFTEEALLPFKKQIQDMGIETDVELVERAVKGAKADMSIYGGHYVRRDKDRKHKTNEHHHHHHQHHPEPSTTPPGPAPLAPVTNPNFPPFELSDDVPEGGISERQVLDLLRKTQNDIDGSFGKDLIMLREAHKDLCNMLYDRQKQIREAARQGGNIKKVLSSQFDYSDEEDEDEKKPKAPEPEPKEMTMDERLELIESMLCTDIVRNAIVDVYKRRVFELSQTMSRAQAQNMAGQPSAQQKVQIQQPQPAAQMPQLPDGMQPQTTTAVNPALAANLARMGVHVPMVSLNHSSGQMNPQLAQALLQHQQRLLNPTLLTGAGGVPGLPQGLLPQQIQAHLAAAAAVSAAQVASSQAQAMPFSPNRPPPGVQQGNAEEILRQQQQHHQQEIQKLLGQQGILGAPPVSQQGIPPNLQQQHQIQMMLRAQGIQLPQANLQGGVPGMAQGNVASVNVSMAGQSFNNPPAAMSQDMEMDIDEGGDEDASHRQPAVEEPDSRDPRARRKRSRSREREKTKRSRSKDRDREKERENDRARRKAGLPPLQPNTTFVASRVLWFGRLPPTCSESEIKTAVLAAGSAEKISVIASKGCAYVTMDSRKSAYEVVRTLAPNMQINRKMVKVDWAKNGGVKADKWASMWDGKQGVLAIPWDQLPSNLSSICDGGMLDMESLPPQMQGQYNDKGVLSNVPLPDLPPAHGSDSPLVKTAVDGSPNKSTSTTTVASHMPPFPFPMPHGIPMPGGVPFGMPPPGMPPPGMSGMPNGPPPVPPPGMFSRMPPPMMMAPPPGMPRMPPLPTPLQQNNGVPSSPTTPGHIAAPTGAASQSMGVPPPGFPRPQGMPFGSPSGTNGFGQPPQQQEGEAPVGDLMIGPGQDPWQQVQEGVRQWERERQDGDRRREYDDRRGDDRRPDREREPRDQRDHRERRKSRWGDREEPRDDRRDRDRGERRRDDREERDHRDREERPRREDRDRERGGGDRERGGGDRERRDDRDRRGGSRRDREDRRGRDREERDSRRGGEGDDRRHDRSRDRSPDRRDRRSRSRRERESPKYDEEEIDKVVRTVVAPEATTTDAATTNAANDATTTNTTTTTIAATTSVDEPVGCEEQVTSTTDMDVDKAEDAPPEEIITKTEENVEKRMEASGDAENKESNVDQIQKGMASEDDLLESALAD